MRKMMSIGTVLVAMSMAAGKSLAAETYALDSAHSSIVFRIKHLDTSYVYGMFGSPTGSIVLADDPGEIKFEVTVKVATVNTMVEKRDTHLKSADFFNEKQFPEITFKSTGVKKGSGKDDYEVAGDLTVHGVTKPVTVNLKKTGEGKSPMGEGVGFETKFEIKRSDFGMDKMVGPVGDDVTLMVTLAGNKK